MTDWTHWIDRGANSYCKLLEVLLVVLMAAMVVMVFGNVVLRYAFNSGITFSEELARWAFVWMTFLGAIVALKDNGHLGTDMLIGRLGTRGKKVCLALAESGMLYCTWLMFSGSLSQVNRSRAARSRAGVANRGADSRRAGARRGARKHCAAPELAGSEIRIATRGDASGRGGARQRDPKRGAKLDS